MYKVSICERIEWNAKVSSPDSPDINKTGAEILFIC